METMKRLEGKVAVVTGSSRGIGQAIAVEFAKHGAELAVTYLKQAELAKDVVDQIIASGGNAFATKLEVFNRNSVREVLTATWERFGRIDILVNNAGFLQQKDFTAISDGDLDYTLAVNLKGAFICIQEIVPFFQQQQSGCIINISSVGGQMGGPKAPHYAAAKAGVISLTKSAARLLAPIGVRVNAIAPGFIKTDMYSDITTRTDESQIYEDILLGRVGEPEEVASTALFLASDEASYITGHVLNVNGGSYLGAGS